MSQTVKPLPSPKRPPHLEPITKYGHLRLQYLEENCPDLYMEYYQDDDLYEHCLEVQNIAETRLRNMMKQFEKHSPPPNRNTDGLKWAAHMSMLKHSVEEIIYTELICE